MALIPGMNYRVKERSANSRLIVSGIDQPAESFIVDPELPVLFTYSYGFPGMQEVVIPKGVAVALKGRAKDFETGTYKPVLTIADGTLPYVGIAPYNISKKYDDQMVGNEPSFVRQVYIELPYIPDSSNCALVKYGAIYGDLKEGDLVTVSNDLDNKGHLTKATGNEPLNQIVGQVIALEVEQEPWGWFKWAMWDEQARQQDRPEPDWAQNAIPTDNGYPYDPRYREGTIYQTYYQNPYVTNPTGIRGLTDGSARATTTWQNTFTIPAGTTAGAQIVVNLNYKNIIPGSVSVSITGITNPPQFTVDYKNGVVTITAPQDFTADTSGTVQYKAYMYGTPPGWDYVGAVGVARILVF